MAEVHYVTSPISGGGKSHRIFRRVSERAAVYFRLQLSAGTRIDGPAAFLQLLEEIGFPPEPNGEELRALHVDVGLAQSESTTALLKLLTTLLHPRDLVYVELPSGKQLPAECLNGPVEVVADMELEMEEPSLVPRAGGGYTIQWSCSQSFEIAAKMLLALEEGFFHPASPTVQINWTLPTARGFTPAELLTELRRLLSGTGDFRLLVAFARLLRPLVLQGEDSRLLEMRYLPEFDSGMRTMKYRFSLAMRDTARQLAAPRMTKRHVPDFWATALCKKDPNTNTIEDKLPRALSGFRFDLINRFLDGAAGARTDVWATLDSPLLCAIRNQNGNNEGWSLYLPSHVHLEFEEGLQKSLETNDLRLRWAQTATDAALAQALAQTFGKRGHGGWEAPLQELPGINNSLAVNCAAHRCVAGVPILLLEQEASGQRSSLITRTVAELIGYEQRPLVRLEIGDPADAMAQSLHGCLQRVEDYSIVLVQCARTDIAALGLLKSLLLDGFVGRSQKPSQLVVIAALVGHTPLAAVKALPQSLLQSAWPLSMD